MFGLCARMSSTSIFSLVAHARHLVGEEDVGDGGEPVQDVATLVRVLRSSARLFLPRFECSRITDTLPENIAMPLDASPRIASPRVDVLDLDHLGAPVAEDRRRGGHEGVVGHVEDANAVENFAHALKVSSRGRVRPRQGGTMRLDGKIAIVTGAKLGVRARHRGAVRGGRRPARARRHRRHRRRGDRRARRQSGVRRGAGRRRHRHHGGSRARWSNARSSASVASTCW